MAGVMTPSPYSNAAPNSPSAMNTRRRRMLRISASSAMIPPSPRLSSRSITTRYFTLTMRMSAQTISDRTP
jgi:hypothetical protein